MNKLIALTPLLFAFGCSGDENPESPREVTYYQTIAPLYADKCVQCHQEGGIAPFALDNPDDALEFAAASLASTQAGTMPPYFVTADGSCGDFEDPRALTAEEKATIAEWVENEMPLGEETDIPEPQELPTLGDNAIALKTPDFVPEIVGGELAEFDEYQCFLVDPELDEDTFLTGYEVIPGNAALVHHVLAFPVDMEGESDFDPSRTNGEVIQALDEESPDRDGWPCFGMAGDGVAVDGVPVTWAPGMGAVKYPHGTGIELPAGRKFVIQVHYNLVDEDVRGESDSTTVKLSTQSFVGRIGFFDLPDDLLESRLDGDPVVIPAGEENFEFTFDFGYNGPLRDIGRLDISGVFPHMHEAGRTMRVEIMRGGEDMCQAEVERWDFNWQLFYFYEEPIQLQRGDRIKVTCGYDTTGLDEPVLPGWGTQNEMCLAGLLLTVPLDALL